MIKIYALNAGVDFYPFRADGLRKAETPKAKAPKTAVSFRGQSPENKDAAKNVQKTDETQKTGILPYEVEKAYFASKVMLQDFSDATKDAIQTGLRAQSAAVDAKEKAKELAVQYKGKLPAKISLSNKDGSEDIFFFTNGILNSYRKNERKTGDTIKVDKLLFFKNGKLTSYEEDVVSTMNKGSAKADIQVSKSIEYEGISTIYKEGYKNFLGEGAKTKKIVRLIFAKPWYFEEGVTEKHKERPGEIKRRLEFSNEEKTAYAYQENVRAYDSEKVIKRSIYIEGNVPYRYCEDESFSKSAHENFNSYTVKKCLYLQDGRWQLQGQC